MRARLTGLLVGAVVLAWSATAMAVSYASGVIRVGDDVTFILNQDAYSVQVILDGGARTLDLPTTAGPISFNMEGYSTYQIQIVSYAGADWIQFIPDGTNNNFYLPLGVAINKDPSSPNFGKVYISESRGGTTGAGRTTTSGIYVLRADGVADSFATGGKDWGAAGNSAPFKSTIGPDGHLYVADFSNDLVWEFNNDMTSVTQLIDGSNKTSGQYVESIWVEGTQAGGDRMIYLVDSHYLDARRGLIRHDLGTNATATANDTGTQVIGPDYFAFYPRDVARDSNGDWYMNQYRYDPTQAPALTKFLDSATLPINTAEWETAQEAPYNGAYGLDINDNAGLIAYANYYDGYVYIFSMADGSFVDSFDAGSRGRELAFDAAGNIVTVDNSTERARFWSPGGWWGTVLGSDGTFSVTGPGAQGVKSNVLAQVMAVRASIPTNDSFAEKFDYVILHLQNSLDPAYWIDEAHLQPDGGNTALNEEKLAANMLDVIARSPQCPVDPAMLQGFINSILRADRLLAMISILEAADAGLNPAKIAEDLAQVAKGDEEAAAGHYANAIEHYRNAWRHAIQLHLRISQDAQGGTQVRFIGVNGKSYLMEVSEDLLNWVPLGTKRPDSQGNVMFTDAAAAGQAQRFYRAVEQ